MSAIVYSYETAVEVPFPENEKRASRRAINDAHGCSWDYSSEEPKEAQDAHWKLNAGQRQKVIVDVYADGTRKMRLP